MKPLNPTRTAIVGMLMGIAEVIPGVSGGTIAFLSGLYWRLLSALASIPSVIRSFLSTRSIARAWREADASFLLLLFGMMTLTAVLVSGLIRSALESYPIHLWSLFTGMIWVSAMIMLADESGRSRLTILWVAAGVMMSVIAQVGLAAQLSTHPVALMIAGAIAVSAWVLPGISGSLILLLLGLYPTVIVALSTLDARVLAPLGLGCVVGLLAFANGLKRVYARFRLETVCFLSGVLLGSLVRLWPWQAVQSYQFRETGEPIPIVQWPVSPWEYESLTGQEAHLGAAIALALIGGAVVWGLHQWSAVGSVADDEGR